MRRLAGVLLALSVTLAGWAPAAAQEPLGPEYTVDRIALVEDTGTGATYLIVFFSKRWGQTPPSGPATIVVHLDPEGSPSTLRWSRDSQGSSFEAEAGGAVLAPSAFIRHDGSTAWWVPFAEDVSSLDVGLDVTAGGGTQTWQEHLDLTDTTPWDPFDPSGPYPVYDLVKDRPLASPVTSSTAVATPSTSATPETTMALATSTVPETISGTPPVTESIPEQTGGGPLWLVWIAIAVFLALVLTWLLARSLLRRRESAIDDIETTVPSAGTGADEPDGPHDIIHDPIDVDDFDPPPRSSPDLDPDDTIPGPIGGNDRDPDVGSDDIIHDPIDVDDLDPPSGSSPDLDPDDTIPGPIDVDDLDPSPGSDDPTIRPDTRDLLAPDDPSAASDPSATTSPDPELEEFRREYPNARRSPDDPDVFEIDL